MSETAQHFPACATVEVHCMFKKFLGTPKHHSIKGRKNGFPGPAVALDGPGSHVLREI